MAPGTFPSSLAARSPVDQGVVTGLVTGLHYLLSVSTQEVLEALAIETAGSSRNGPPPRARLLAVDCLAVPLGLAVARALPPRAGEPALRGLARQVGWRSGATGLGGVVLLAAEAGVRRLDDRLELGGRLVALPLAVPVGLGLSFLLERSRSRPDGALPTAVLSPALLRSLPVAAGVVGAVSASAYGEHVLSDILGRRLATVLPGPPELWRVAGHGAFLAGLGVGVSALWHRAMQRIEAGTSADVPVLAADEATRWVPATNSGGPGSLVPWVSLGREGRRHALTSVRPTPVSSRPDGVPDLSIGTVMGKPARAAPVQVYVGLSSGASPRQRVDLALAEMENSGAFDRSLIVLISPTGTG